MDQRIMQFFLQIADLISLVLAHVFVWKNKTRCLILKRFLQVEPICKICIWLRDPICNSSLGFSLLFSPFVDGCQILAFIILYGFFLLIWVSILHIIYEGIESPCLTDKTNKSSR